MIRSTWLGAPLVAGLVAGLVGCSTLGANTPQQDRLYYNEAMKVAAEEQLLLNIVRLRYTDSPSSLTVSSIATQNETAQSYGLIPFFGTANNESQLRRFSGLLPQLQVQTVNRPTISLTPLDDQDFTRRLFTPMTAEGVLYLAKTSWPIATVFRLWLESLNWVANAAGSSGPTTPAAPPQSDFQRGMELLQALQDRGYIAFATEERETSVGGELPADRIQAEDLISAARDGLEYRPAPDGRTWSLIRKRKVPVMRVHPDAIRLPEMIEMSRIFRLRRESTRFDIEIEKVDPFTYPPRGIETIDLEARSLLQVLYFVSKGVEVPSPHLTQGIAVATVDERGRPFDWTRITKDLFRVASTADAKVPATAHVSIRYQDHWFFIDKRDGPSMATFTLLMELARLELPGRPGGGPSFTLPLGGR